MGPKLNYPFIHQNTALFWIILLLETAISNQKKQGEEQQWKFLSEKWRVRAPQHSLHGACRLLKQHFLHSQLRTLPFDFQLVLPKLASGFRIPVPDLFNLLWVLPLYIHSCLYLLKVPSFLFLVIHGLFIIMLNFNLFVSLHYLVIYFQDWEH